MRLASPLPYRTIRRVASLHVASRRSRSRSRRVGAKTLTGVSSVAAVGILPPHRRGRRMQVIALHIATTAFSPFPASTSGSFIPASTQRSEEAYGRRQRDGRRRAALSERAPRQAQNPSGDPGSRLADRPRHGKRALCKHNGRQSRPQLSRGQGRTTGRKSRRRQFRHQLNREHCS